jgi:hypothetical protein
MPKTHSASSNRSLLLSNKVTASKNNTDVLNNGDFFRDSSTVSTADIRLPKLLDKDGDEGEETLYQVEITNPTLTRKVNRSELASKSQCLTRRWQTALASTLVALALVGGIGK